MFQMNHRAGLPVAGKLKRAELFGWPPPVDVFTKRDVKTLLLAYGGIAETS
jgi:hypothetical protein